MKNVKVLVVDDSAFMRRVISDMLSKDSILQVTTARDGRDALAKIKQLKPDIITLDVEMPLMNGLEVLREIMAKTPLPVIMLSSHTQKGSQITMEALSAGAVDFVAKPASTSDIKIVGRELIQKIKAASRAKNLTSKEQSKGVSFRPASSGQKGKNSPVSSLVAIGSSTGGPSALEKVLLPLPANFPTPIIITQHMPEGFTRALAERLDRLSRIRIKEASSGDPLEKGVAYIAPGGFHMVLSSNGGHITLNQDPPVEHVRPSVNVMLHSAIPAYGSKIIGVILTGMGKDGADAMAALKQCGGRTVVQDEASSVIFSMPNAVIKRGAADIVAPLHNIPSILIEAVGL